MGPYKLKAVDHVNFEICEGEVFGLVGESGCGKTTTGRTIIKLYDATGGNVYFKGQRIVAGIGDYKEEIKSCREKLKNKEISEEERKELEDRIKKANSEIKSAKFDSKNCSASYIEKCIEEVKNKYTPLIQEAEASGDEEKVKELKKEYAHDLKVAKKERIVNGIQMIFQDPIGSLDPRMTVREIISEGLVIKGVKNKKVIDEAVYDVLEKVGLVKQHANRYPHEFSGGQRQRIGVARSMTMKPSLIIADEPVSALDVSIQAQVINLLDDLRHETNLAILFIAHDLSVVKYFSDKIGVMYFGKMVELTTSDDLFARPCHPYTKALLSAIPVPDPDYEKNRKRLIYNPVRDHDYREQAPYMQEVFPGHLVLCNDEERERFIKEYQK
ncbi:MAG: ATP-binding cassette domain-containing protein [Bacilli bacterium]|nr:ATP-binding cassette domain-containing protein [Bacilli bacterium]